MKLQKQNLKRTTKIDIKVKNVSTSPRKEFFRANSPNIIAGKRENKAVVENNTINRAKVQSPLRNSYNVDAKLRTNTLLTNLKNNKNMNRSIEKTDVNLKNKGNYLAYSSHATCYKSKTNNSYY